MLSTRFFSFFSAMKPNRKPNSFNLNKRNDVTGSSYNIGPKFNLQPPTPANDVSGFAGFGDVTPRLPRIMPEKNGLRKTTHDGFAVPLDPPSHTTPIIGSSTSNLAVTHYKPLKGQIPYILLPSQPLPSPRCPPPLFCPPTCSFLALKLNPYACVSSLAYIKTFRSADNSDIRY